MKNPLIYLFFSLIVVTGCVKSMANDDENNINFSFHERRFGSSGQELLKDDRFTSLKIEIQHMPGVKPDLASINNLRNFLLQHLHKPDGIFVVTKEIKSAGKAVLNKAEIDSIATANRKIYSDNNQIAVHILYTDGTFTNKNILGEAYKNTSIVIYGKALMKNSNKLGKPSRTTLESTLLLHEMCHLLGLTNEGSTMYTDHLDEEHKSHCENKSCLMYYGIDIGNRFGPLLKREIPQLDEECLFDLVANGGK